MNIEPVLKNTNNSDPKQVYKSKQEQHKANQKQLEVTTNHLATARGGLGILVLLLLWLSLVNESLAFVWLIIPTVVFLVLALVHTRATKQLRKVHCAIEYYAKRLNCISGHWSGQGNSGTRYLNTHHPYSSDLDIFAEGSLFEFICSARTRLGEDMLATWLNTGADVKTIEQRQQAIKELCNQIEFREQLAVLEEDPFNEHDQRQLQQWSKSQTRPIHLWQRIVATVLGVLAVLSIMAWSAGYGHLPFLVVITMKIVFYATVFQKIKHTATKADAASSGLTILSQVLELIEQKQFKTPLLQKLHTNLQIDGHTPSWQIRRLRNSIQVLNNCLHNQFFSPIAFVLGIPVHAMHHVECRQKKIASNVSQWFETVGQIEALNSFARYAFENPNNSFPQLVPELDAPYFDAIALGHPLFLNENCVNNDMHIDSERRFIMVSGSNMSGKSTLLRTIGINLTLALCGAPVRAKKLTTSRFVIGTVMRTNDSLQQGVSLFFSAISRIKRVVELADQSPTLFFLLDEILQGTNSHDRRIGTEGIIYQLLNQNAVGLVTTHDLALTNIVKSLGTKAANIHFQDHLVNGRISFDYKIRPGVVQNSNALQLMRMIGLHVDKKSSGKKLHEQ